MVISSQTSSDALFSSVQCELEKKYKNSTQHFKHITLTFNRYFTSQYESRVYRHSIQTRFLTHSAFSSWQRRGLCDRIPNDCRRTWKPDLSWFYWITLDSSCSGTSNHQSCFLTAAKTLVDVLNTPLLQHGSNKLNSLFTDRQ